MRGPEDAIAVVMARLEAMPAKLAALAIRLGVDPATLPAPALILDVDQPEIDSWPALTCVEREIPRVDELDRGVDDGVAQEWRVAYGLRVYGWVRGQEFADTATLRRRYVLALLELLLESPSLGDAVGARFAPSSLRFNFTDVGVDATSARSIAALYVDLEVTLDEVLAFPAIAQAATATATVHPALQ